jgi:hypothetical protein
VRGWDARVRYAESPCVLFHAVAIGAAPGGLVLRVAVRAKQSKVRLPIVAIDPVGVIENQAQRLPIPNERFAVEAALLIVAALGDRGLLLCSPLIEVLPYTAAPFAARIPEPTLP